MTHVAPVTAKQVERRIPPERATPVTVEVTPQAVCFFYHPDAPGRRLQLDADDRGVVRFHARALKGATAAEFQLECHDPDGQVELYGIVLATDVRYTTSMSAGELALEPNVEGTLRPALAGDPLAPSNRDLIHRGYPPRPDPMQAPAQYARWLENASRSCIRISERRVAHPEFGEVTRGPFEESQAALGSDALGQLSAAGAMSPTQSSHWCGAYFTHPIKQFGYIQADWNVPPVFDSPDGPGLSAMVQWVGLDHAGEDLYQAGTGSECLTAQSFQITTYFLWMETLPWSWWQVPNFALSPGDRMSVDIFVSRQYGGCLSGEGSNFAGYPENSVWFHLNNATTGASFVVNYPTVAESPYGMRGPGHSCQTAAFILERPLINGHLTPLAQFLQPATMTSCAYGDERFGDFNMTPLGADQGIPPFDGQLTYLNMVDPSNHRPLASATPMADPYSSADAQAILFGCPGLPPPR